MATDLKHSPDVSVSELITGIVGDLQHLMQQQFELLKHDVKNDLVKVRDAGLLMGAGAACALVAVILIMQMLVYLTWWLLPNWPLWAWFAVWGGVMVLVGAALIVGGRSRISTVRPMEEPAATALKENVEWISHPK